jgi:predicted O-methyltransferase YrrM
MINIIIAGIFVGVWLIVGLALFMLFKIRRIHVATYEMQENIKATLKETTTLFAQIQAHNSLEKILGLPKPLPPMRGWAGSPDFLLTVAQDILRTKPENVTECSSGLSTLVSARCLQINGKGHVYSLEHDAHYAEKTRALLLENGLSEWATVFVAPLEKGKDGLIWYRENTLPKTEKPIDVLIIDGPPAPGSSMARFPAIPRLKDRFANKFAVFLDDADRADEIEAVKQWQQQLNGVTETRPPAEKGLSILRSA